MAQTVKRLSTMQETWVQSLGQEDLLEKEMATHSSILAWKIPWMEEPGRLQSKLSQESDMTEQLHFTSCSKVLAQSKNQSCCKKPQKPTHHICSAGLPCDISDLIPRPHLSLTPSIPLT